MEMDLKNRISRLEAIEDIKQLKYRYCDLVDKGLAGDMSALDELVGRFSANSKIDYGEFGIYKGKEQISMFFKTIVVGTFSFGAHMVFNPIIRVDGNFAVGRWYVHAAGTLKTPEGEIATWTQAKYFDEYEKIGGSWKFKSITVAFDFLTPYNQGWARTKMIQPG
jgi:hypothetical protein